MRILVDGVYYRERRGKMVPIPDKWVGRVPSAQTIRQRDSKLTGKVKRVVKDRNHTRFKDRRDALKTGDDDA